MDFKKYFISFIDSILEVDKDNKYALKYKNNAEFLKYNELSKEEVLKECYKQGEKLKKLIEEYRKKAQ